MAGFVSGDVVVVAFPFTDLTSNKVRPALILATSTRGDVILCQITSRAWGHPDAVSILAVDFEEGDALPRDSFALPHRVVTAHESCLRRRVGRVRPGKLREIRERVCAAIWRD